MQRIRLLALVLVDAAVLAGLRPHGSLIRHLAAPRPWLAAVGPDRATVEIAAAALWLVAAWLAVGLLASCVARLPGAVGRCAHAVAAAVLPRAVYRLAAGAAGLGVVLAPGLANASAPPSTAHSGFAAAVALSAAPAWPTDGAAHPPAWPTSASAAPVPRTPARAAPAPEKPTRAHSAGTEQSASPTVVVQPGDSLWRIAAAHLPASAPTQRVAAAWPRWYAANRRVIGDDPGHITPGQLLAAPKTPSQEGSA